MLATHPLLVPRLRKSRSYTSCHPDAPLWSVTGPFYLFYVYICIPTKHSPEVLRKTASTSVRISGVWPRHSAGYRCTNLLSVRTWTGFRPETGYLNRVMNRYISGNFLISKTRWKFNCVGASLAVYCPDSLFFILFAPFDLRVYLFQ
jgi:hypothetical protein